MRICFFSPDVDAFATPGWRETLTREAGPGHQFVLLTNSWAEAPAGVEVTGGTRRASMRIARKLLSPRRKVSRLAAWRNALAEPFLGAIGENLLEGLRAADPDLVVCTHHAWTRAIQRRLRTERPLWPCITLGDPIPEIHPAWRRYDSAAKVSIVLPTHNGERYLAQSIRSCLSQTHANLELIVVDDGSGAAVAAVVGAFADPRLKYVRHETNQGLPRSLNTGFAQATGDFCSWTSDDNWYEPEAIQRMVAFLQTYQRSDFVYAQSYRADEESGDVRSGMMTIRPPESLAEDNYIGGCFLYKRVVYDTLGGFNPNAVLAEDYEYWVRVSTRFTMQRLFLPLYTYRFHGGSLTSQRSPDEVARQVSWIKQAHGMSAR